MPNTTGRDLPQKVSPTYRMASTLLSQQACRCRPSPLPPPSPPVLHDSHTEEPWRRRFEYRRGDGHQCPFRRHIFPIREQPSPSNRVKVITRAFSIPPFEVPFLKKSCLNRPSQSPRALRGLTNGLREKKAEKFHLCKPAPPYH